MREPDAKKRPRALFIRDLVPVRGDVSRPPDALPGSRGRSLPHPPRDSQVTSLMVGEETDSGTQR